MLINFTYIYNKKIYCLGGLLRLYNTERFLDFMHNEILPLCNLFPKTNSILIINNTKIYHYEIIAYKFPYKNFYILIKN